MFWKTFSTRLRSVTVVLLSIHINNIPRIQTHTHTHVNTKNLMQTARILCDNSANNSIRTEQHFPCLQHKTPFLKKFVTIWQPRKRKISTFCVFVFLSYVIWHQKHWCYCSNVVLCVCKGYAQSICHQI